MARHRTDAETSIREAAIAAFHPGPARDFVAPVRPVATGRARLDDLERRFLERAIDRHAERDGELGDLARSIVAQRAVVGSER